ncbi:MAG: hypothetical protein ABH824_06210 [Nanoarchaeota archaeon]|nr:hypothetical protein [Nanoarchaeota archaeon]MBU1632170.1 hypothetical protein [Nanoarchaeota archaeon]MBU1875856.1 hypothetical protein [Nanoarchaeota archaeon]
MFENKLKKEDSEQLEILLGKLDSKELLKIIFKKLQGEEQIDQLISSFQDTKSQILIPLSIFSYKLQPAEALCKYLKENENHSYKQIAVLINRNEKSVWATYKRASKKRKQKFVKKSERYFLPISILKNRSYSLLESVIFYLNKTYKLSNPQIAKLLKKSPNSIAVLMKRAREKYEREK